MPTSHAAPVIVVNPIIRHWSTTLATIAGFPIVGTTRGTWQQLSVTKNRAPGSVVLALRPTPAAVNWDKEPGPTSQIRPISNPHGGG